MTSIGILQLISPALPVGAFSYSEGLEWQVHDGKIFNEATLSNWINSELLRGQIRLEAASQTFIRDSLETWQTNKDHQSISRLLEWDSWLLALRDSKEIRDQQKQMGHSLIQLLSKIGHPIAIELQNSSWPIAWGWGGIIWDLSPLEVTQGYLYNWVANQLSASLRLISLGPTEAQRIQFNLLPLIESQSKELISTDPHHLWTGDIGAIMAQSSHPELYSKLFRN